MGSIITARKRSLRRLCFHRWLSVHRGGLGLCMGGLHPGGSLSGRPPQTETPLPWTKTPLDRETLPDIDPPGQRPP